MLAITCSENVYAYLFIYSNVRLERFDVEEWFKADCFFLLCSRENPEIEPSNSAHWQATLVEDSDYRQCLACSVWADSNSLHE